MAFKRVPRGFERFYWDLSTATPFGRLESCRVRGVESRYMEYLIGVGLALLVCTFARLVGFDRDRVFYPTMVLVVATYYILFAVMGSSMPALGLESAAAVAFLVLAVVGFRKNLQNPGVPAWWPSFCLSYDVLAGVSLLCCCYCDTPDSVPRFR